MAANEPDGHSPRDGRLQAPVALVVMGVSGCGKTVVGEALAARLGCSFIEGDDLHSPENIAKMERGAPLTDADRAGWLDAIGDEIARMAAAGERAVVACSALKRSYRARIAARAGPLAFVFLELDRETARARVAGRKGHFMPASLIDSQFAALEPPGPDERALTVDATRPVGEVVAQAERYAATVLSRPAAPPPTGGNTP